MSWPPVEFVGVLYTTPRVGQNAVLHCLRSVIPGADEWGAAQPLNGRLAVAINRPPPATAWTHLDTSRARWGDAVWMRRRDRVAQAISWAHAAQTGLFRSDAERRGEPVYDRAAVIAAIETIDDQEARWAAFLTGKPYMEIWYEDHVESEPAHAAEMILRWWEFMDRPASTDLTRVDSDDKARWRTLWDQGH